MTRRTVFFLLLSLFLGCTRTITEENQPYQYDSAYLGEYVTDSILQITFAPPIKWEAASSERFSTYDQRFNEIYPNQVSIRHLFNSPGNTNSFLTISTVVDWPEQGVEALQQFYEQDFKKMEGGGGKITHNTFEQNNLLVHSWKTEDQVLIRYKVIFMEKSRPVLQMDFNIPFPNYDKYTREQVESSIASVAPEKN